MSHKSTAVDSDTVIFSNDFVKCYLDRLVIRLYYFPFGSKTVHYDKIQSCELMDMRDLGFGKSKLWGMSLSPIWWHCDFSRNSRRYYILLDADHWPKIGLTMDDDDTEKLHQILKDKIATAQLSKDSLPF